MADVKRGRVSAEEVTKILADREKGLAVEDICSKYQRSETVINKLLASTPAPVAATPEPESPAAPAVPAKKRMGRPKGSKNAKKKAATAAPIASPVSAPTVSATGDLVAAKAALAAEMYILKLKMQLLDAGIVPATSA